jgi:hypothetical protein
MLSRPAASAMPPDAIFDCAAQRRCQPPHIGLAGDTYTMLLSFGSDTARQYCLISRRVGRPEGRACLTGTTFRSRLRSWRISLSLPSEGQLRPQPPARRFTFQPTHLTSSARRAISPRAFCASARQPASREFFVEVGVPEQPGPPRHRNRTPPPKPNS